MEKDSRPLTAYGAFGSEPAPLPDSRREDYNQRTGEREDMLIIVAISVIGFLVGAAVLFGVVSGPLAVLAAPVLAVFGWFYLLPVVVCVTVLWAMNRPRTTWSYHSWLFVAAGALGGGLLMLAIGVRGPEPIWLIGYLTGGCVGGGVCAAMVVALKNRQLTCQSHSQSKR
jgi:hypothetical protein